MLCIMTIYAPIVPTIIIIGSMPLLAYEVCSRTSRRGTGMLWKQAPMSDAVTFFLQFHDSFMTPADCHYANFVIEIIHKKCNPTI